MPEVAEIVTQLQGAFVWVVAEDPGEMSQSSRWGSITPSSVGIRTPR